MRSRVCDFLTCLQGDAVVITHAGVIKLIMAELLGLAQSEWLGLHFDYGSLTTLSYAGPP